MLQFRVIAGLLAVAVLAASLLSGYAISKIIEK